MCFFLNLFFSQCIPLLESSSFNIFLSISYFFNVLFFNVLSFFNLNVFPFRFFLLSNLNIMFSPLSILLSQYPPHQYFVLSMSSPLNIFSSQCFSLSLSSFLNILFFQYPPFSISSPLNDFLSQYPPLSIILPFSIFSYLNSFLFPF